MRRTDYAPPRESSSVPERFRSTKPSATLESYLSTEMTPNPNDATMINTLSQTARAIGEDAAHDVTARIMELKPVRALPTPDAASIGEAWFRLLDPIGVERPDHFVSLVARQVRARRDREEAEQRIAWRRLLVGLPPPKRRFVKGKSNPGWDEPPALTSGWSPEDHDSVFKEIERRDDSRALNEEIGELPPEDQSLIRQVYWDGRSQSEIARESGKSPSAVRSHLDRLRGRLGVALTDRWGGEQCLT